MTTNKPEISISNYTPVIYETAVDFGDAVSFDGVDDYVKTNNLTGLNTGNQVHTIEQWVYLPEPPSGRAWLSLLGQYGTGSHHWLINSDGEMQIGVYNGSGQLKPTLNVGEWTHLATVYDGTTLTLYINGEEYGSTSANFNFSNTEFKLGLPLGSESYFKGKVDDVRIWNTARSETDIKDNLYQKLEGTEDGLVAYYNFDEDSIDGNTISDITSNANDGTLTNRDDTNFVDSEIPTFQGYVDIELDEEVTSEEGITVNYKIGSDSTATQDEDYYNSQTDFSTTDGEPQTDSIFIDEGEDSGRIYLTALPDAVVEGDETIKLTLLPDFNKALDLDGVDDYLKTNNLTGLNTGNQVHTIEQWVYLPEPPSERAWLSLLGQYGTGSHHWLINSDGEMQIGVYGSSGGQLKPTLNVGEWTHLATVYDGTTLTLYINGEKYDSTSANFNFSNTEFQLGLPLGSESYFKGEVDEVRIWNTARSETEIKENYKRTLTGLETGLVGYYNFNQKKALLLDGNSDYVEITNSDGGFADFNTTNFSIELWFKTDDNDGVLIGSGDTSANFWQVYIEDGKANFNFDTGGNVNAAASSENAVNDGKWHHLVAIRDGINSGKLYIDGKPVGTLTLGTSNSSIEAHTNVYIGRYGIENNNYFAGEIDEIKIWNKALSATEVGKNYSTTNFDKTDSNLKAYYTFDDSNANDLSSSNDGTVNGGSFVESGIFPEQNFTNSLAYDPFATNGPTYSIGTSQSAEITIQDTDAYTAGILIIDEYGDEVTADNPLVEDANGDVTFSLKLTSQPTDSVSLSISNSSIDADWDEWQQFTVAADTTITVSSNDDNYNSINPTIYTTDSSDTIKLKISEPGIVEEVEIGGGQVPRREGLEVSEEPEFVATVGLEFAKFTTVYSVDLSAEATELFDVELAQYVINENGEQLATFNVNLTQQPTADVTVTFNNTNNTALTFTADNWNQAQKTNITLDSGTEFAITTSSTDSNYRNQTVNIPISSTQVDISLNTNTSTLVTSEDGDTVEFAVRLTSQPNDNVTVTLDINDDTEGTFADGSTSQSITIAPENWDTYQTVTVTGVNDFVFDGDTEYSVSVSTSSNDSDYNDLITDNLLITNRDNETSDIEGNLIQNLGDVVASLSVSNAVITEGETGTFTVQLSQAATEDTLVQYEVISNSATSGDDFTTLTGEVTVLAGQTSATIDLASLDDFIDEDSEIVEIQLVSPFTNVDVSVATAYNATDNTIGLQLASGTEDIQISPGDELVFSNGAIATVDVVSAEDTDSLITLSDDAVTTVNVILDTETGIGSVEMGETTTVAVPFDSFDLSVTTAYDDAAGTVGLQFSQDGTTLAFAPGDEIVFSNSNDGTSVTAIVAGTDTVSLSSGQEVSVPVTLSDANVLDTNYTSPVYTGSYVLDEAADNFSATLTIDDNDTAKVLITSDAAGTNEIDSRTTDESTGESQTFYVQLDSKPTDDNNVVVYLGTNDTEEGLLSDADQTNEELVKLVFSPDNWNIAQEVTINPVNDDIDEGPSYQFDVSSVFNSDVVINSGDSSQDTMDDNNNVLITETYASSLSSSGNGLPDDGYFAASGYAPEVQLAYSEDEAADTFNARIVNYGGDAFSFDIEEQAYSAIHIFATSTLGNSDIEVTINYSDGSTSTKEFPVPDWFDEITETEERYYLINGADRYNINNNRLQDFNNPAIFGFRVEADESKTLSSVTVSRKTQSNTNSKLVFLGSTGVINTANNYQIISTVISDDVKYNEDNVILEVNGDFDSSSDTTINLSIGDLGITTSELLAGTQLSFANGMELEVSEDTTLSNSATNAVKVAQVSAANKILANTTAFIDDDSSNSTEYTQLVVTADYKANQDGTGGSLELQIDADSTVTSVQLSAGEELILSNGAVFTLDSAVTLSNTAATVVSGTINSNLLKVAITEVSANTTASVTTDITDENSGETKIIVTTAYDEAAGTISLKINDTPASTVDLLAGTQINFSNGAAVILSEDVTLSDTATSVNVTGVDNKISTSFTESISTDIKVTNTDDDTAGISISASNPIAAEGVDSNSFTVQLDSKPLGEVEVTLNPSNDDIQLDDEFIGESTTLTFTPENWDTAQEVTVTAVDDYDVEYNHSSNISVSVKSERDRIYDELTPPNDIEVKIIDNDLPTASIQAIAGAAEAGKPGYFIVTLDNPAPDGVNGSGLLVNYTVVRGTDDTDGTGDTDDLKPFTGSVRIAPGETRSQVIAFPIDDFIVEDEDNVTIELTASDDYLLNDANSATLEIEDNDKAGIRIIEVGTTTVTEGNTAEFYISLLSQPVENVKINLSNLATERELEVTAVSGNTVTLKLADSSIDSLNLPDGEELTLNGTTYQVQAEEDEEDYFIGDSEVDVTLDNVNGISVGDNLTYSYEELSFANDELIFNSNDWYKLQTVTITGVDDNVVETGDFHTSSIQYTFTGDSSYDDFKVDDQTINIVDRIFDKDNTTESLTEGILGLQDAIDNISLPIVGNLSDVSPSFLEDFLDNLIDEVKATNEITADSLSEAFNTAFDNTINDADFTGEAFTIDVDITDLSTENIEFALGISGETDDEIDISGDLGLPALGIGIAATGGGKFGFDYGIDLAFGINKEDGFYINTEDTSFEVTAGLGLEDFSATGNLAFLQLDIEDGIDADNGDTDGTTIDAKFLASFTNPDDEEDTQLTLSELNAARDGEILDLINYSFSGDAVLDLDVTTSFEGDTAFPSFGFNLYSEMPIFNYGNADDEEEVNGATLTINSSGTTTVREDSSTKLNVTATDTASDIRLAKGTELTFNGKKVIVSKTKTISPGNEETIEVEVADDGNAANTTVDIKQGETAELESGDFNISFNDITLDLGEFVTDLMTPIIGFVEELIEPFEPIIDVLQTEVDLLDTFGLVDVFDENGDGAATIIEVASTLATLYSGGENTLKYAQFFDAVTGIIELVETVEELSNLGSETLQVEFGDYVLENFSGASEEEDASTIDIESKGDSSSLSGDAATQSKNTGNNTVTNFFNKLDELGIGIPLLENPFAAINLLLGQDIDLVTYDIPELDIGFDISQEFPIFGSIKGLLAGSFSLYSDLVVGFDTYGLSQWQEADFDVEDSYLILDGFYLSDVDPDTGEDVDELTLDATIAAGVSASAVVAKASVKGGITGTAGLDITDGGELTGTSDGKLRGSEVLAADSLLDLFSLSGSLEAFVKAVVKVGVDVGLFEVMKTVWKEKFSVTLFEFELGSNSGTVSQSYIEGATVFFDSNLDGIWQEGEPITTSNADGSYNLEIPLLFFDTNDNGKIDPEEGRIVTEGGTDTSSGVAVETPLIAPYGAKMVTPLTTLKQKLIEDGSTPEEAEQLVKEALELPEDIKLEEFDPLGAMSKGDERGTKVYKAHVQMQSLFAQTSEFIQGFDGEELEDKKRPIPEQAIDAIAKGIKQRKGKPPINFSDSAELEELIKEPLEGKFKPKPGDKAERLPKSFGVLAQTIAAGNKEIDEVFKGVPPKDILGKVAPIKKVTQDKLPKELRKLIGGARREDVTGLLERVPDAEQFLIDKQSQPGDGKQNQIPVIDSEDNTTILPTKPKKLAKGKRPRNLLELDGDDLTDTKIEFSLSSKNLPPGRIHEIAIFTTEDAEGTIKGLSPEDAGYKEAALSKARSIFSILPDDFITNSKRIMKGFADKNIGFLLIKNGSLDSVRRGRTSLDSVLLGTETQGDGFRGIQMSETGESSFRLSFEDEMGAADFTDIVIDAQLTEEIPEIGTDTQGNNEGEMLDLRNYAGKQIKIEAPIVREESAYENVVGFYVVEDENGAVIDPLTGNLINPGEAGYTKAALRNSQNNAFQMGENGISGSREIAGGKIFAPFAIADGTLEQVLDDNPDNDPQVYFAHIAANSDGVDHICNLGGNTWGVEDMLGGGDMDCNDIVFKLDVTVG